MVVFDMAGTTVDEDNIVYKTLQACINAQGYNFSLEEVLEHGGGKEKLKAIQDTLSTKLADMEKVEQIAKTAFAEFIPRLNKAYEELDVKPYADVEQTFEQLRTQGIKVVLNTGYNAKIANQLINKLKWRTGEKIDLLVTSDDVKNGRPAPDMIHFAMKQFELSDASKVIKIGDTTIDIQEGQNAKCGLSIGITTGAQAKELLKTAEPDVILNELSGVLKLI